MLHPAYIALSRTIVFRPSFERAGFQVVSLVIAGTSTSCTFDRLHILTRAGPRSLRAGNILVAMKEAARALVDPDRIRT
jgi:hypothetical protein